MPTLVLAMALFVGTHFLMSHPLRRPMVGALGEKGFLGVYSLVSLILLFWAVRAYGDAVGIPLWVAPSWLVALGWLAMLFAAILFAGSVMAPNPALVQADGLLERVDEPRGVMRITRHPMMWSFAIWALVHIFVSGRSDTLVLAGGILILALVGAAAQDVKKRTLVGERWAAYTARTHYWPRPRWPGVVPLIAGLALYAVLVFIHPLIVSRPTGLLEIFA